MSNEKTLASASDAQPVELDAAEGEEVFAAAFAAPEGFKARPNAKNGRTTHRVKTFNAAITRWANDMFTTWDGLAVLRKDGLTVYAEDFPGIFNDEAVYDEARAALRDWLLIHGFVDAAKHSPAPKGSFRFGGSFHEVYQRGENEGQPLRYARQIRITLVK